MRFVLRMALLVTFIVLSATTLPAQWMSMGPYGKLSGYTLQYGSFAQVDTTLFVTDGRELYASTDGGTRWDHKSGFPYVEYGIFGAANLLFSVGTNDVQRSSDHGTTWDTAFGADTLIAAAKCLTRIDNVLIVGIETSGYGIPCRYATGVVRSTDNGVTWQSLPTDSLAGLQTIVTTTTGRILQTTSSLVAVTGDRVYRSTDLGASWVGVGPDRNIRFTAMIPRITWRPEGRYLTASTRLYAASWLDGVYYSDDLGATWTPCGDKLSSVAIGALAVSGTNGDTLLAGTSDGLYRLPPGTTSWEKITAGIPGENITALHMGGSTVLALCQTLGVFRSDDGGGTWRPSSEGMRGLDAAAIAFTDSAMVIGGTTTSTAWGGYRYTGWTAVMKENDPAWQIDVVHSGELNALHVSGTSLFAGLRGGVARSSDDGRSWDILSDGLPQNGIVNAVVHTLPGPVLFAGTNRGVYTSTDNGTFWAKCPGAMPDSTVRCMHAASRRIGPTVVTTLYAGTEGGKVYYSATGGTSWVDMSLPSSLSYVWAVEEHGSAVYAATTYELYRTTDFGTTWSIVKGGLPASPSVRGFASSGGTLFLACTYRGIYFSSDGGVTWNPAMADHGTVYVNNVAVWRDTLYALVEDGGVWKRPLSEIVTGVQPGSMAEVPRELVLHQNYPNPFNPSTTIRYDLPGRSHVTLTLYSALGQRVAELVNEDFNGGYHSVVLDGARLASGVYFYRLQVSPTTGSGGSAATLTKSLLLVK